MKIKGIIILILIFVIFGDLKLYGETPDFNQNKKVDIQFRLASNRPSWGLTEMAIAGSGLKIYVSDKIEASNNDIINIASIPRAGGEPGIYVIELAFSKEAARTFTNFAKENKNRLLAIFIDGKIIQAPRITEGIKNGKVIIDGNFTKEEALRNAMGIIYGKYGLPIKKEDQPAIEQKKEDLVVFSDDILSFSYDKSFNLARDENTRIYTLTKETLIISIMDTSGYIFKENLENEAEIVKASYEMADSSRNNKENIKPVIQDIKAFGPAEVKFQKSSGYLVTVKNKLFISSLYGVYLLANRNQTFQVSITFEGDNINEYRKIILAILNSIEFK